MKIALLGCGTVGTEVALRLLKKQGSLANQEFELVSIYVSDLNKPRNPAIPRSLFSNNLEKILNNPEITTIIEVMGGLDDTYRIHKNILSLGINLITANKAVLSKYLAELTTLAKNNNSLLCYEAAVGGAIPIVRNLHNYITDGTISLQGVLNGTTNYILSEMSKGITYDKALGEAQRLGYAEKDPTADVSGLDTAQKLTILTNIAFGGKLQADSISTIGIDNLPPLIGAYVKRTNSAIKLIGKSQISQNSIEAFVTPAIVDKEHPLALETGPNNKIIVESEFLGNLGLSGPGAGGRETAGAIIADLLKVFQNPKLVYQKEFTKNFEVKSDFVSNFYTVVALDPGKEVPSLPAAVTYLRKTTNFLEWVVSQVSRASLITELEALIEKGNIRSYYSPVPIF